MAKAIELIDKMNATDDNNIIASCKRELRKVLKQYNFDFIYDSYMELWIITC